MKRFIISVPIIAIVIMLVTFLQDNTYSKFKKGININITDTTGKLVCDATLDNPGTYVSDDGWAYFKVIVKNYDSNDVITDVPVEYYLDIKNSNGSNALYRVTTADETSTFMSPLTTSNYLFAAGEKQTNEFIIEVKTGAEDAEDVDFDVDLTCRQVSKNASVYDQVVNYVMLYDGSLGDANDNKMTDITGGWNPNTGIRFGGCGGDAYNFSYSYNVDNMYVASSKNSYYNHGGGLYTGNTITLDDYSALYGYAKPTRSATGAFSICYDKIGGRFCYNGGAACTERSTSKANVSSFYCSLEGTTGAYTVGVGTGTCGDNVASASANVYDIWLTYADNWQELASKAGITASSIDDILTNSHDLLNNRNAVIYMIYNCTGDFMSEAVFNTTFMTELETSPYKDIILANEHWNKFITMVS